MSAWTCSLHKGDACGREASRRDSTCIPAVYAMAKLVPDNDGDYGYDLSAEDEDFLFDVADSLSPPPIPLRSNPLLGATAEEAGRLSAAALDPGFSHAHEPGLFVGKDKAKASPDQAATAAGSSDQSGQGLDTSTEDDVSCPDCMFAEFSRTAAAGIDPE